MCVMHSETSGGGNVPNFCPSPARTKRKTSGKGGSTKTYFRGKMKRASFTVDQISQSWLLSELNSSLYLCRSVNFQRLERCYDLRFTQPLVTYPLPRIVPLLFGLVFLVDSRTYNNVTGNTRRLEIRT